MDRKEKINQFSDNVNLNPIDCSLEFLSSFLSDKVDFLNSSDAEKRDLQVGLYNFFRQMVETTNANLIRNGGSLPDLTKEKRDCLGWTN